MFYVLCLKNKRHLVSIIFSAMIVAATSCTAQIGIWTSAAELAKIPMSGPAWEAVLLGASQNCANPDIANQDDDTNVYVLAAAIVYARTGDARYKNKVIAACDKLVAKGNPGGLTLAWGRETGAYAMAADLVGYRTPAFETWLRNMAEVYKDEEKRTLIKTFQTRANNWGSHAFGSLCAIYRYLGDKTALTEIRDYWIKGVTGPNPGFKFGKDLSWHANEDDLRLFNPKGAMKKNTNIDGVIPDDMRRGGSFQTPPGYTNYAWGFMQGQIMAARILERAGMPIWAAGDSALYRAAACLQIRFETLYGNWAAHGDDEWMLPFLDKAYGVKWSGQQKNLWKHGKNAGWGYVTLSQ
jgi:hypothetical protein